MARTRSRWPLLFAALLLIPLLELVVLIQVGQVIGAWWTILLLIADSIIGSWLLKREGVKAWAGLRRAINEGRMPANELADGILVVLGGTLMISPGFVTDAFGILAILPVTRPIARRLLARVVARRLIMPVAPGAPGFAGGSAWGTTNRPGQGAGPVVSGEVIHPPQE